LIGLAGLLLAGCFHKGKPENLGKTGANDGEGVSIEDRVSELSKKFGINVPDDVEKAALNAVDGSAGSGLATRDAKGLITVIANLPEVSGKDKYSAQLVSSDNKVSLGTLVVSKAGWMIEKTVNADPASYKTIEVLLGDKVILRGNF